MNELIFFSHIGVVLAFILLCLKAGRGALTAFAVVQAILANLFVLKQISLFGLFVTCSDVFAVGGILSLNLLQERYGKEAAKEAAALSLLALVFFALMAQFHLSYTPAPFDTAQTAYAVLLGASIRINAASIATFYIVQRLDIWFFSKLTRGQLTLRLALSLVLSQAVDTVLFSILGLYGQVESLMHIIFFSFLVKMVVVALSSPFIGFSKHIVSRDVSV